MKILVLNCGSSSIKYKLFDMNNEEVLAEGIVQKIGLNDSFLENKKNDGDEIKLEGEILDHKTGIEYVLGLITSEQHGSLKSLDEIDAVGHRVVHGGERFNSSILITDEVIEKMKSCIDLAPLHNPPNLEGIYAIKSLLPDVVQAGVFDTAFHQSMPSYSYMYAIPYSLYEKYSIRKYGFHGTSHRYVSQRACEILNLDYEKQKIITCHLGNGSSLAAIDKGKSIDTSMGFTPVEGLIMGTRTGDMDLGVLLYIMDKETLSVNTASILINKRSGLQGISGVSSDMRDIEDAANNNNEHAKLALDMFHYRVKKYIGAYAAALKGVDIIVFTGGIGENSPESREEILKGFEFIGLKFDKEKNKSVRSKEEIITINDSKVKALIVPTNEELVIARDTYEIISNM